MKSRESAYTNHDDDPKKWAGIMKDWWDCSFCAVTKSWLVNVQPLAGNKRQLIQWINDRVDRLVDIITWDKGHAAPAMAQGVVSSRYEWIVIFGNVNSSRSIPCSDWRGTIQSVYESPPQRKNEFSSLHGATMPIHLPYGS